MTQPEQLNVLPGRAGAMIVHGVKFWYAHWCVVSCPFLEEDADCELGEVLCDWAGTPSRLEAGYKFLRTIGETMQQIFFANLGGVAVTPNNHTVFKDVARHFKKHEGKLWVFLAHAIERSQEIHRNIIGALGKTSNTEAIKRWLAQIKANALVTDAAQRSGQNLRSMKKSWADRTAKVVEALELLNTQYRSTDGRYMDEDHECWPTTRSGGWYPFRMPTDEYGLYASVNQVKSLDVELKEWNSSKTTVEAGMCLSVDTEDGAVSRAKGAQTEGKKRGQAQQRGQRRLSA